MAARQPNMMAGPSVVPGPGYVPRKIEAKSLPHAYRPSIGLPSRSSTRPSPSPRSPALLARSAGQTATAKERPRPDLAHAGIGLVVGIAVDPVQIACAAAELLVDARFRRSGCGSRPFARTRPGRRRSSRPDARSVSAWIRYPALMNGSRLLVPGCTSADAVIADEAAVADQMRRHARDRFVRAQHAHDRNRGTSRTRSRNAGRHC